MKKFKKPLAAALVLTAATGTSASLISDVDEKDFNNGRIGGSVDQSGELKKNTLWLDDLEDSDDNLDLVELANKIPAKKAAAKKKALVKKAAAKKARAKKSAAKKAPAKKVAAKKAAKKKAKKKAPVKEVAEKKAVKKKVVKRKWPSNQYAYVDHKRKQLKKSVSVPEPGALSLIALGLAGIGLSRRKKKK